MSQSKPGLKERKAACCSAAKPSRMQVPSPTSPKMQELQARYEANHVKGKDHFPLAV